MNLLLYCVVYVLMRFIQALPLDWVARLGRFLGGLAYYCDARHRRVAIRNLTMCLKAKSPEEIRAIAKENFKRIGENFSCPVKMAVMDHAQITGRVEVVGSEKIWQRGTPPPSTSIVVAIGHFGNFETLAHMKQELPSHQFATTYRSVRNPAVDKVLGQLRASTGCLFFERRSEGAALRAAMRENHLMLGLLADQHSGDNGLRLPFLEHDCNTSKAPAVFALRFNAPLHTAICYRTKLAHWRIEVGDLIPTQDKDCQPRSLADIMLDVNRAFEVAVRRDPANWFWVHNRWKILKKNSNAKVHSSPLPSSGERIGMKGHANPAHNGADELEQI